jgi:hypothetical protein
MIIEHESCKTSKMFWKEGQDQEQQHNLKQHTLSEFLELNFLSSIEDSLNEWSSVPDKDWSFSCSLDRK